MGTSCTFPAPYENCASLGKCLHNAVHDNGLRHHNFESIHPTLPTPSNHRDHHSESCCKASAQLVRLNNSRLSLAQKLCCSNQVKPFKTIKIDKTTHTFAPFAKALSCTLTNAPCKECKAALIISKHGISIIMLKYSVCC